MSTQPNNSLTLKEWFQLAENYAAQFAAIGHVIGDQENRHYARKRFDELHSSVMNNLKSPALLADTPEEEGVGGVENNMKQVYLAYTVAIRLTEQGNAEELQDAETDAQRIALQILARMRRDRRDRPPGTVFAHVNMEGWQGDVISYMFAGTWAGYRVMVPVQVAAAALKYDAGQWDDDNGAPLLTDASGLSCPNLNHPSLGLTPQQRLDCLGVDVRSTGGSLVQRVPAGGTYTLNGDGEECEPLEVTVNGQEFTEVEEPCGGAHAGHRSAPHRAEQRYGGRRDHGGHGHAIGIPDRYRWRRALCAALAASCLLGASGADDPAPPARSGHLRPHARRAAHYARMAGMRGTCEVDAGQWGGRELRGRTVPIACRRNGNAGLDCMKPALL